MQSLQFEWMNSEGDTFAFVEVQRGFGAQGATGDPKPQMFNLGFVAKDAAGDLKPQMINLEGRHAFENADAKSNA